MANDRWQQLAREFAMSSDQDPMLDRYESEFFWHDRLEVIVAIFQRDLLEAGAELYPFCVHDPDQRYIWEHARDVVVALAKLYVNQEMEISSRHHPDRKAQAIKQAWHEACRTLYVAGAQYFADPIWTGFLRRKFTSFDVTGADLLYFQESQILDVIGEAEYYARYDTILQDTHRLLVMGYYKLKHNDRVVIRLLTDHIARCTNTGATRKEARMIISRASVPEHAGWQVVLATYLPSPHPRP